MLISLAIGLTILASVLVVYMQWSARQALIDRARAEGQAASQFAVGLRGFVATLQANPSLIPATQNGVNWLKSPTCGGLATNRTEGYVPCNFTGETFGAGFQTTFAYSAATRLIEARTTFIVPIMGDGPANRVMMAERVVETMLTQQVLPNSGMFFSAWANVPANATGPAAGATAPGADAGRVVLVVNNTPSNDIWLRSDGTNRMLANLNGGGFSLENFRDARLSGDLRVEQRTQLDGGVTVMNGVADLRGGAITSDLALTSIGKFASQGIYDGMVLTGATSYWVAKPNCAQAGNQPAIYAALQGTGSINANGYIGDAITESRVDVQDYGTSWLITPKTYGTRFDLYRSGLNIVLGKTLVGTNAVDSRIVVLLRCR